MTDPIKDAIRALNIMVNDIQQYTNEISELDDGIEILEILHNGEESILKSLKTYDTSTEEALEALDKLYRQTPDEYGIESKCFRWKETIRKALKQS